jgi:chromosome segregation ATPase
LDLTSTKFQDFDAVITLHLHISAGLRLEKHFLQAKIKQSEANLAAAENAVSTATRSLSEGNHLLATERQKCREISSRLELVEDEERKAKNCLQDLRGQMEETKKDLHAQLREAQTQVKCSYFYQVHK